MVLEMNRLVSVIVPVYNSEKYVDRTIESLLSQDYEELEIILVDDGSTDSSRELLDRYSHSDDRIITIFKNHSGVSAARNAGLSIANGEFVTFVDADDWVENDYISYLVRLITTNGDFDMAVGFSHFSCTTVGQSCESEIHYCDSHFVIEKIYLNQIFMAVWNKIYRKKFFDDLDMKFNESIWYGEGMLFNMECLSKTNVVPIGYRRTYHYVENPNSAMRFFKIENELCGIRSMNLQKKCIPLHFPNVENAFNFHMYSIYFNILCRITYHNEILNHVTLYNKCLKFAHKYFYFPLRANISKKQKVYYLCVSIAPCYMAKRYSKRIKKQGILT